jgi:hypothetical protein
MPDCNGLDRVRRESLKGRMLPERRKAMTMIVSLPTRREAELTGCSVTHSLWALAESVRSRLKRPDKCTPRKRRNRSARLGSGVCQLYGGQGTRLGGRVNPGELSQLPLDQTGESSCMRLSQKGTRSDVLLPISRHTDRAPPVDRQHPPHCVIAVELGKPVDFRPDAPVGKHAAKRVNSQQVKDRGESKCRTVTVRTGDNVLHPKGAQTSAWCGMARAYAESSR